MVRIILFFSFLFFAYGCSEWLGNNENPNMLDEAPVNALLTSVIEQTASNQFQVSVTTSLYSQYLASPNAGETDRYGRVTLNDCWASLYSCMVNANDLYFASIKENDYHHAGAALVLLSYNALTTTDLWGDIPFSEAFKGQLVLYPKYDKQQFVYDTIISNLNTAINLLNKPNPFRSLNGDILYNNKPVLWKKFAFALKARTLIHLSKKSNFNAALVLSSVDSSFTSNTEGAALIYAGNKLNPWYSLVNSSINGGILNGYLSSHFIESLKGNTISGMPLDPRITAITDTLKGAKYSGTINGSPPPATGFCTLTLKSWQAQKTAPIILLSYPEIKLIEAEASLLNNDNNRAYNAYLKGIESHISMMGIASSQNTNYISNAIVATGANLLTQSVIQYQKWLVLFLQPEGWTEVRKNDYNYPAMVLPVNNMTNNVFIRRILYPESEMSYNSTNVPVVSDVTELLWFNMK
jgi:hypothetical protein